MGKEDLQFNPSYHTELYYQHLCYIISQGFHLSDMQGYKALVEDVEYRCNHCGRTAKSDANLCIPANL